MIETYATGQQTQTHFGKVLDWPQQTWSSGSSAVNV